MKLITKDMWRVTESHRIAPITSIVNEETNSIITFQKKPNKDEDPDDYDDEWYLPQDYNKYFDTEGQCIDYINERRKFLRESMPKVKAIIDELEELDSSNEDFKFSREDYLPDYLCTTREDYYRSQFYWQEKLNKLLKTALTNGVLNINAETVRICDVCGVQWHNDNRVTIVTRDGNHVTSFSEQEYELVKTVFGYNSSGRILNRTFTDRKEDNNN